MARQRLTYQTRPHVSEQIAINRAKKDRTVAPEQQEFDMYRLPFGMYTYRFADEPMPEDAKKTAHYRFNGLIWICTSK